MARPLLQPNPDHRPQPAGIVSTDGLPSCPSDHGAMSKTMKRPESGEPRAWREVAKRLTEAELPEDSDIPAWKWSDYEPDWWDDIDPLDEDTDDEEE